jgi:hypothetical protein
MRRNSVSNGLILALLALGLVATSAPSGIAADPEKDSAVGKPWKPVGIFAVASYDHLKGDVSYVGEMIGRPELAAMAEGGIALLTAGRGLQGLDKTRPVGIVFVLPEGAEEAEPIVLLPVTDAGKLLALAGEPKKKDGLWEVEPKFGDNTLPGTLYVREHNGWALGSGKKELLSTPPAEPGKLFGDLLEQYDIAVRIDLAGVPASLRKKFFESAPGLGSLDLLPTPAEPKRKPGDAPQEDSAAEKELETENAPSWYAANAGELEQMTIGWKLDAERETTHFDVSAVARPGSKLAQRFADQFHDIRTRFVGFVDADAALKFNLSSGLLPEDIANQQSTITDLRKDALQWIEDNFDLPEDAEIDRKAIQKALGDLFDVASATIATGEIDMAAMAIMKPEQFTFSAASFVTDGRKVEAALKTLATELGKSDEFPEIKWNAETFEGVRFHVVEIPIDPNDVDQHKLVGDKAELVIGCDDKSIYFAVGRSAVAKLKFSSSQNAGLG